MSVTNVQRKLQKLLALSESPNSSEAASAKNKISELMERYNIKIIDIEDKSTIKGISTFSIKGYSTEFKSWESKLAAVIADPFNGKAVITNVEGRWGIMFISMENETGIIVDMYKRLRRIVSKMTTAYVNRNHGNKEILHNSYAFGMIKTIHERLLSIYQSTNNERALIVLKGDIIQKELKNIFGTINTTKTAPAQDKSAFMKGMYDAKAIQLQRGIKDKQQT